MYTDILSQCIKNLEIRKEFKELKGINKLVIKYLLAEVKEAIETDKIFIRRPVKQNILLFEIKFQSGGGIFVLTRHRHGAAHIKYIKECRKEDIESLVRTIKFVCDTLNWVLIEDVFEPKTSQRLEIYYKFQEEATP